jgi:hypothetical protein
MNVFIVGNPKTGKSTLAKALCEEVSNCEHISIAWFGDAFRKPKLGETDQHYLDECYQYLSQQLKSNPRVALDVVAPEIEEFKSKTCIIDGVLTPKDFVELFNYNTDIVIFLNRVDAPHPRDHENIGVSVIRDYCFWLSSAGLIERGRWLEFNYRFDEPGDLAKELGSKNTVVIIKGGIKKVIEVCKERLQKVAS